MNPFLNNCPLPGRQTGIITMEHGSGGLMMHRLVKNLVFETLQDVMTGNVHDGAMLKLEGNIAFSTDSFVVKPLFFPGGNIGELAVNGTVNDVAMCGAVPQYLSLSFILEEGFLLEQFEQVLSGVRNACLKAGVKVVTGDTKVVEHGKGDELYINTSGIGKIHPRAAIGSERVKPGDVLLLSGQLAAHGTAVMCLREGLAFETTIQSDTAALNPLTTLLLDHLGNEIRFLRDPTRGGLATTLNELVADCGWGIEIEQAALPLQAQVEAACEVLGLDPLYVANEGIFLAVVSPDVAAVALQLMQNHSLGVNAAIIGRITAASEPRVLLRSKIGGTRVVHMLTGAQLPRIC
ncbi:hydrogenase expression/formation protein HypE [Sphingobacteriales bacterium UPWRP_1]|nr:hydrogenase expression/formation protein HypE [Sphingobacteriales bacterium UPWRP_1]